MAAKIDKDTCAGCGACVDSCPVSAITIDADKAATWLKNGAQPTDTVKAIFKKNGIL